MTTLIFAYTAAWVAVGGYVAWLGLEQRALRRRMIDLESRTDKTEPWRRAA